MKKTLAWLGAGALVGALAFMGPSTAAPTVHSHYPSAGWELRDAKYPDRLTTTDSQVVNLTTVKLVRNAADVGTSAETTNLDFPVEPGDTVSVDYQLSDTASFASGAIRLFVYDDPNSDTMNQAPKHTATAGNKSGKLTITVGYTGKIGSAGLVYDESNSSTGYVLFKNLKVNNTKILFKDPRKPVTPRPPSVTNPTCERPGKVMLPRQHGVKYTKTDVEDGKVVVTATALKGYRLEGETEWTLEIPAKLPENHEKCVKPTPTATPSVTASPSATATPSATVSPSTTPSESSSPTPVPSISTSPAGGGLPLTGSNTIKWMVPLGLGVVIVGSIAVLVAVKGRKDTEFTAE